MKSSMVVLSVCVVFMMLMPLKLSAQDHAEQIRAVRAASNAALKALDEETNLNYLTDDVLITTGSGTLIKGKAELIGYLKNNTGNRPMYWVRTPDEIDVNEDRGIAWERGQWNAYFADDQKGKTPIFRGKYAAYWVLISSEWKIKSQLFVSLE